MHILVGLFLIYIGCKISWVGVRDILDLINRVSEPNTVSILMQIVPGAFLIWIGLKLIYHTARNAWKRYSIIHNCTAVYDGTVDSWIWDRVDHEHGRDRRISGSIVVKFYVDGEETLCKFSAPLPIEDMYPVGSKVKVYSKDGEYAWDRKRAKDGGVE